MNNNIQLKEFLLWQPERKKSGQIKEIACSSTSITTNVVEPRQGKSTTSLASNKRRRQPFYIKLAEEKQKNDTIAILSDSSTYDSFNEQETDICRDSSDSDGYVTEGIATMDVLEYELDDSSSSEDLYTHGSSSGTDDLFVAAVARAIFDPTSSSSEQFEIKADDADTEESDAPTDPELGRADYWTCIKCKNQKNNPMYRFCEKCYQIRKTHFPPRPKHRKKRSKQSKDESKISYTSSSATSSSSEDGKCLKRGHTSESVNSTPIRRKRKNSKQITPNSAGDSSCSSSQELSQDDHYQITTVQNSDLYCSKISRSFVETKTKSHLGIFTETYPDSQGSTCSKTDSAFGSQSSSVISKTGSSLSSNDFTSEMSPHSSEEPITTRDDDDQEINSTNGQGKPIGVNKKKKPKKRKFSKTEILSDTDDDDLITNASKKMKTTIAENLDDNDPSNGMCIICLTQPKNSAFVHNRFLHVCCCYRCAVKVWNKRKRCPVCNSQAKNVLKMFVH